MGWKGDEQIQEHKRGSFGEVPVGRSQTVNGEDFSWAGPELATALHVPVGAGGPVFPFKTPLPSWLPSHRACAGLGLGVLGPPEEPTPPPRRAACMLGRFGPDPGQCPSPSVSPEHDGGSSEQELAGGSRPHCTWDRPLQPAPPPGLWESVHLNCLGLRGLSIQAHTPCLGLSHCTT